MGVITKTRRTNCVFSCGCYTSPIRSVELNRDSETDRPFMNEQNLETLLQKTSPVKLLRNSAIGPYVYPVVASEYTNWRDEQRAWQKTCVLFNQSYHMTDMYVEGPDALKLLSDLGVNTFKTFGPNKAKQYVVCNHDGYVIGDVILFGLEENLVNLVG